MSEEARHEAYVAQRRRRTIFQRWLDTMLTPASDAPAEQIRDNFEPIERFIKEGPDVGQADERKPQGGIRFN